MKAPEFYTEVTSPGPTLYLFQIQSLPQAFFSDFNCNYIIDPLPKNRSSPLCSKLISTQAYKGYKKLFDPIKI